MSTTPALAERQIRLLELLPFTLIKDKVPNCNSIVVELDETVPAYEALSYTWEATDNESEQALYDQYILLNGNRHYVRPNLSDALYALMQSEARLIWVDNLCINQQDNSEKAQQISMMAEIYQRAVGVIVWLGDTADVHYKDNFRFDAATVFHSFLTNTTTNEECYIPPQQVRTVRDTRNMKQRLCLISALHTEALHYWTISRYWRRVWIVQELVFAKALTVQLGALSIKWDLFKRAAIIIDSHLSRCCRSILWKRSIEDDIAYDNLRRFSRAILDIENTRETLLNGSNLERQLRLHSGRLATTPRDMIYALLGLVSDWGPENKPIKPDYDAESDVIIICDAIRHIIASHNSLSILCGDYNEVDLDDKYNSHITTLERLGLPSWALCFAACSENESNYGGFFSSARLDNLNVYSAAPDTLPSIRKLSTPTILKIEGLYFDRVAMCAQYRLQVGADGTVYLDPNQLILADNNDEQIETWFNMAKTLVRSAGYHATDEPWTQAFARTMLCDVVCRDGQYLRTESRSAHARTTNDLSKDASESSGANLEEIHASSSNRTESHGRINSNQGSNPIQPTLASNSRQNESQTRQRYGPFALNRIFFITEKGHFGIGPASMRLGDTIAVLFGSNVPFVLRSTGVDRPHQYQLLGDCYCHGIMDGEAVIDHSTRLMWFQLV